MKKSPWLTGLWGFLAEISCCTCCTFVADFFGKVQHRKARKYRGCEVMLHMLHFLL